MAKERVRITNKSTRPMCFPVGRIGVCIPPGDGSMAGGDIDNKNLVSLDKWAAICKLPSAQKFIEAGLLIGPDLTKDVEPAPLTAEILKAEREALAAKKIVEAPRPKKGGKKQGGKDVPTDLDEILGE